MPSTQGRINYQNRIRLKKGEPGYATKSGTMTLAIRSQSEVARNLGISRQAVQQLERTAFHKIRLRLLPILKELNPELFENLNS